MKPHPFTLRQLQYLVTVDDLRSFSKAAARCHTSQPSLSAQIAVVEESLGVRIFERDRQVIPTPAGTVLLARARIALRAADDLSQAAQSARSPFEGPIRIGVIPTIAPYLLPALAPAILAALPGLITVWVEAKTPELSRRLQSGDIDLALLAAQVDLGDVDTAPFATDPFVLAGPSHRGARGTPLKLSELGSAGVLLLEEGHCLRDQALAACATADLHELAFRATSLPTLVQMVAAGLGVTLLPRLAVATEVQRAALQIRPLIDPPTRTLVVAWRRGSPLDVVGRRIAEIAEPVAWSLLTPVPLENL